MSFTIPTPRHRGQRHFASRRTLTLLSAASLTIAVAVPSSLAAVAEAATPTVTLMVSTSSARTSAVALNGGIVTGKVAIFTSNDSVVKTVRFYLDKATTPTRTEGYKPFDFAGTASNLTAQLWDTAVVTPGTHTMTASVDLLAGGSLTTSASFTVPGAIAAPTAPLSLSATPGDAQISLAWSPTSSATSYTVYRNGAALATTSSTAYVSSGLVNGTSYSYYVTATGAGGTSPASATVNSTPVATAPAAPTALVAAPGNTQVALTWTAPATATAYRVYRNAVLIASPTTPSYAVTSLTNGTSSTYYVTAVAQNSPASAASASVVATPVAPTPPPAPINTNAMPVGNLTGWTQVFADDFTKTAPLGSFLSTYGSTWGAYPSPWSDTSRNGRYDPAKTLSAANGLLDIYVHTEAGIHYVAAPTPKLPTMTYGRYSIRFQSDSVAGYKTAWLLWPDDGMWPAHGEIDFPEGNLDQNISAFAHWASPTGGQDAFSTTATYATWHTATTEWTPGKITFLLDGKVIGTSTKLVPSAPMHWVIQTETQLSGGAPADSAAGHVRIDWVTAYTYTP